MPYNMRHAVKPVMGRPLVPEEKKRKCLTMCRFTTEEMAHIDAYAESHGGLSRSAAIQQLCAKALAQQPTPWEAKDE